jgi:DNA-binding MarR family transcriptional regulator
MMATEEPIGLLIGAARRRIKQAVGSRARSLRLTTQQFWVLVAISEHPGCTLGALAAHLRMDKPTASRVVFTLLKRALVEVRPDAEDRRRTRLYLRGPGEALSTQLHDLAAGVRAAMVRGLSAEERTVLRVALRKVIANMDRLQHGGVRVVPTSRVTRRSALRASVAPNHRQTTRVP